MSNAAAYILVGDKKKEKTSSTIHYKVREMER